MDPLITWWHLKVRLGKKNRAYGWVLSDLEDIKGWAEELVSKWPDTRGEVPPKLCLENEAIQILTISKLEHLLTSLEKIEFQGEIKCIIRNSKILSQLEKDWLIYLFLIRHTLTHTGGRFDKRFFKNAKKYIKELKLKNHNNPSSRSPLRPSDLIMCIGFIFKLILLDIAGDELTTAEKADIAKLF